VDRKWIPACAGMTPAEGWMEHPLQHVFQIPVVEKTILLLFIDNVVLLEKMTIVKIY